MKSTLAPNWRYILLRLHTAALNGQHMPDAPRRSNRQAGGPDEAVGAPSAKEPTIVSFDEPRLKAELMRALTWQIGVEGMEQAQPSLISYDAKSGRLILRCLRGFERRLIASLALLSRVGEQPARLESVKISGTLHGLGGEKNRGQK